LATDIDTLTQEVAALMKAHNTWTMRVERLRRTAQALTDGDSPSAAVADLEGLLRQTEAELEAARARAAEWESKARSLSQLLYKERSERCRRIRELEQELSQRKQV